MSQSDTIELTVQLNSTGSPRFGFGRGLILSHKANTLFAERYRIYSSRAAIVADGFSATGAEVRWADAMFAQSPNRPKDVAIGRAAAAVTQVYTVTVSSVLNTHAYTLKVAGDGFSDASPSFTSDGSATNDEIVAGLVTALNAVASKNYTATATGPGGSQVVTITGDAASNWFSVESPDTPRLKIQETHADPGVAAELDAIFNEFKEWYALFTVYNSKAYTLAAQGWVESNGDRVYYAVTNDSDVINTTYVAATSTDVGTSYKDAGRARTHFDYHPSPAAAFDAALGGRLLPLNPGRWTSKFKTVASGQSAIAAVALTDTQLTNLRARNMGTYIAEAGRSLTIDGKIASTTYKFFDNVVKLDWFRDDLGASIFGVLAGSDIITFDDEDIAKLEAAAKGSCARAESDARKVFAKGTTSVSFPKNADIDPADREIRELPDVVVAGQLAGAIHKVKISVVATF